MSEHNNNEEDDRDSDHRQPWTSYTEWLNSDNSFAIQNNDDESNQLTEAMNSMSLGSNDNKNYLDLVTTNWINNDNGAQPNEDTVTLPPPETFDLEGDFYEDGYFKGGTFPSSGYKTPSSTQGTPTITTPATEPVKRTTTDDDSLFHTTPTKEGEIDELDEFNKEFEKRLKIGDFDTNKDKTLIILSPLSYRHVFSRTWYPKRYQSSVVERPERLMACSLGISAAMFNFPSAFQLDTCERKSKLTSRHVRRVHGSNWGKRLYELCAASKDKLAHKELEVPDDWHSGDIYLSPGTIDALEGVVGSVETAIERLYDPIINNQSNRIFLTIRPPGHHSHPCVPSGFCLVNNAHIAIQYAAIKYNVTHAVILDFDLHHGDGSQDICWKLSGFTDDLHPEDDDGGEDTEDEEEHEKSLSQQQQATESPTKAGRARSTRSQTKSPQKDKKKDTKKSKIPKLGYFSLHDINSFPTELGYATAENIRNASVCLMAHNMCIWNIHLEPYNQDHKLFDSIYQTKYKALFEKANQFLQQEQQKATDSKTEFKPIIILSAGFDASEYENVNMQRHAVNVPTKFYNRFTGDAMELAKKYSDGKVLSLLEGGYSDGALSTGVFSHLTGLAGETWDDQWSHKNLVKEFEKGCKLKYSPPSSQQHSWIAETIKLGRSLWPAEIKEKAVAASKSKPTTKAPSSSSTIDSLATPARPLRHQRLRGD